jgi:hypothetical protein
MNPSVIPVMRMLLIVQQIVIRNLERSAAGNNILAFNGYSQASASPTSSFHYEFVHSPMS